MEEARSRGMEMSDPCEVEMIRADPKTMEGYLENAAQRGAKFAFVVHPDTADEMHCKFSIFIICFFTFHLKFSCFEIF